jgi:hypothetical protein
VWPARPQAPAARRKRAGSASTSRRAALREQQAESRGRQQRERAGLGYREETANLAGLVVRRVDVEVSATGIERCDEGRFRASGVPPFAVTNAGFQLEACVRSKVWS